MSGKGRRGMSKAFFSPLSTRLATCAAATAKGSSLLARGGAERGEERGGWGWSNSANTHEMREEEEEEGAKRKTRSRGGREGRREERCAPKRG